ncbi:acyl-CoA N-acyltransferase [Clohesyomyces aquaticus]|uniref:Acyl-CoA N-acyltransferase n=1 Tax=Clohesyomyces aquaticus TaxID=1231657 RepID=A0A1Y1ZG50_9PLEO|nr:acyl-CoA N-acyltransferase [Clohesyomyces aquaticus]
MPVPPEKRFKSDEIKISLADENDMDRIADGLYTCFPEVWWAKMEPPEQRPPEFITRRNRLAARLRPSFKIKEMNWIKATLTSNNLIIGIAGWMGPGNSIIGNIWRRSAIEYYGFKEQEGWTDEDIEEMWTGVSDAWDAQFSRDDEIRKKVLGDEPHWYLGPLMTWPEYQGRGVGRLLLDWCFERADRETPPTTCYLESAPTARAVYLKAGFVPIPVELGEHALVRRGPPKKENSG